MVDDAADRLTTYRQICAQVAREFNIIACFMCKPFMGVSANGCHHNVSLWKGGKDEFKALGNDPKNLPGFEHNYMYRRGGENTFMPDTKNIQMPGNFLGSLPSAFVSFLPPRHSEMLWWQPLAETPMKGLHMKQAMMPNSRATCAQIWR